MKTALNVFGLFIFFGGAGSLGMGEISFGLACVVGGFFFSPFGLDIIFKTSQINAGKTERIGVRFLVFLLLVATAPPQDEKSTKEKVAEVKKEETPVVEQESKKEPETETKPAPANSPKRKGGAVTFNADGERTG